MKKIKMMLLSLALLAGIGGALAFKAKFSADWCTTTAIKVGNASTCIDGSNVNIPCPIRLNGAKVQDGDDPDASFYCTTNTYGNGNTCTRLNGSVVETTACGAQTFTSLTVDGF